LAHEKLDSNDIKILELLTQNARLDYKAISEVVGISDRSVARHIENLEKKGIIEGYSVKVGDKLLNLAGPEVDRHAVNMTASEWESLRNSMYQIFKSGSSMILFHIGMSIGKNIGEQVKNSKLENQGQCFLFAKILENKGWGKISFETIDFQRAKCKVLLIDFPFKKTCKDIECYEIRGTIAGFLETIFNKKVSTFDGKCALKGDDRCEFTFNGGEKVE